MTTEKTETRACHCSGDETGCEHSDFCPAAPYPGDGVTAYVCEGDCERRVIPGVDGVQLADGSILCTACNASAEAKAAEFPGHPGHHQHTDACRDRWGRTLCKDAIDPLIGAGASATIDGVLYATGEAVYGPGVEHGKTLFELLRVTRDGMPAGCIFYDPHSYPLAPWQARLAQLRMAFGPEPDPFRQPWAAAFDFGSDTLQAAIAEFARRGEARVRWSKALRAE